MELEFGGVPLSTPKTAQRRLSLVIWGPSGAGKTTLASTAPGPILLINFDPDGPASLGDREDVLIADFSGANPNTVMKFKNDNPGGLNQLLEKRPDIQTVVFDSVTSFNEMALRYGITEVKGATLEAPTLQGYGRRNSYTMQAIASMLKATAKYNKHVIFICHEDAAQKDELTGELFISLLIGGKMQEEVPIKFSEVWHLRDTGNSYKVSVRSSRMRKPMKTRMFNASEKDVFDWKYNAIKHEGEGIKTWFDKWNANNGAKIPLPT